MEKVNEQIEELGNSFKNICNCKLINDLDCSTKNIIKCEDCYMYKCCNRLLTDEQVHAFNKLTKLKFSKKSNKDYDIAYYNKMLSKLKEKKIIGEKEKEIREFFKDKPHSTGTEIYKEMLKNKFGLDNMHILEIWTLLNNIEHFNLDWETELQLNYYYLHYKTQQKLAGKLNNKKLTHVVMDLLKVIRPDLWNKWKDGLYYN